LEKVLFELGETLWLKPKVTFMEPLIPGYYYHIYNHVNGNEQLFREEKNYYFFLKKFKQHIIPVADIFAYCLMPNHFHFLLRLTEKVELQTLESFPKFRTLEKSVSDACQLEKLTGDYISKQFSNMFSSYTQAYNRMYNRRGSLFIKNFRRKRIHDENYFIKVVNYIHFNPVTHGFVDKPADWRFSSYNAIVSTKKTMLKRDEVLEWFGGLANFMYCHLRPMDI
jgi:putative transposase